MYLNTVLNAQIAFVGVIILCITTLTAADPQGCYYCNSDVDGSVCNSPFNTSLSTVRIQLCSNSTLVDNFTPLPQATNSSNYVCTTLTYYKSNALVTIRGCQSSIVNNRAVCSYLSDFVTSTGYVTNFECSSCDINLCNAATPSHYLSLILLIVGVYCSRVAK